MVFFFMAFMASGTPFVFSILQQENFKLAKKWVQIFLKLLRRSEIWRNVHRKNARICLGREKEDKVAPTENLWLCFLQPDRASEVGSFQLSGRPVAFWLWETLGRRGSRTFLVLYAQYILHRGEGGMRGESGEERGRDRWWETDQGEGKDRRERDRERDEMASTECLRML